MRRLRSAAKVLSAICREQRKPTPNRFHATLLFNLNARQTVCSQSCVPFNIQPYVSGNKDIPIEFILDENTPTCFCSTYLQKRKIWIYFFGNISLQHNYNYKKHKINYYSIII